MEQGTMQRISSSQAMPPALRGAIIALGNFDGFHMGHRAVVARAVALAREMGAPAIVATFDPHPVRHFRPDAPPFRLTTLAQRQRLFGAAGADAMLVLDFGDAMASLHADAFIADMLVAQFGARGVVTGDDFVFGAGRSGNGDTLRAAALDHGFVYEQVAPVEDGGVPISSSRIRDALRAGDMATATRLLTRPFAIEGVVEHGAEDGRKLGFPTANIDMGSYLRPAYGVYAVTGRLADGTMLRGAANLGIRPQFLPPREWLEPYFFDFDGDLYGQTIEVALHAWLRGEARFDTIDALRAQIARDCDEARRILVQ